MSGLGIGNNVGTMLSTQLMVDYLTGCLGGEEDQEAVASIARLIIAGNSVNKSSQETENKSRVRCTTLFRMLLVTCARAHITDVWENCSSDICSIFSSSHLQKN